tara:strand:- start:380 stop:589 length:210 start_codon:yes stop_codon:yes gene_type:complete
MGYKTIFYYETYDGKRYHFQTKFCYRPSATKAWRQLKKMLNEKKDNIRTIGYGIGDEPMSLRYADTCCK